MTSAIDTESSARPAPSLCVPLLPLLLRLPPPDTFPRRRTLLETGSVLCLITAPITAATPSRVLLSAPSANSADVLEAAAAASIHRPAPRQAFRLRRTWKNAHSLAPRRGEARRENKITWCRSEIKRNIHRWKGWSSPSLVG